MKLISKRKDYYDHYARNRQFSDQTYVWERKPIVKAVDFAIPNPVYASSNLICGNRSKSRPDFRAYGFIVWFCGTAVPVVQVRTTEESSFTYVSSEVTEFYYSFDSVPDYVKGEKPPRGKIAIIYKNTYQRLQELFSLGNGSDGQSGWNRNQFESVSYAGKSCAKLTIEEMHRLVGSPVFCHYDIIDVHKNGAIDEAEIDSNVKFTDDHFPQPTKPLVLVNPSLDAIKFRKHIDPFQAFLDIERYIANNLAPQDKRKDIPIPDKLKAQSKGFDKMSFRKEPSNGRKKSG